jgi:hypothetical protein
LQTVNKNNPYTIYLPVPTELSKAIIAALAKNQNIELVSNPENADCSISCMYSRNINKNKDYIPGTMKIDSNSPYYRKGLPPLLGATEEPDVNIVVAYSYETVGTKRMEPYHTPSTPFLAIRDEFKNIESIAKNIVKWFEVRTAEKGIWLNYWPRK